ncbi:MAG TPA: choice-of-anchor D domain-containing protein [Terriglobales bacterium]|nr:choice-of-anchor D domain-containing protein [Terriglobales bacterium]
MGLNSLLDRFAILLLPLVLILLMAGCGAVPGSGSGGAPSGVVFFANPSLDFGAVIVGGSKSLSDVVTNTSNTPVTLSVRTSSQDFQVSSPSLPLTLAPRQRATVAVDFKPQALGNPSSKISFVGTDGGAIQVDLPVRGSAVKAWGLSVNPGSLAFGGVAVGASKTLSATLSNSGSFSITVEQASASTAAFTVEKLNLPLVLQPGQSMTLTVAFAPTASGLQSGGISVRGFASRTTDRGRNGREWPKWSADSVWVAAAGTGTSQAATVSPGQLSASPSNLSFGTVAVGSSNSQLETVTNPGGSDVTISQITSGSASFRPGSLSLPATLSPGRSLTFSITFAPQAAGNFSSGLTLASNGSNPVLSVALSGAGTSPGQLSLSPSTLSFGSVTVGSSKSLIGTLTASTANVVLTSGSSNSGEFSLSGLALPMTLAAGQSQSFTVTFTPQSAGATTGSISFGGSASGPVAVSASGTGTAAAQHQVTVSWVGSSSTVIGYKVYRGSQSGGPYVAVNSSPDASLGYVDSTVQAGMTYYYVVTAVDTSGTESVYSNEARAAIPNP